jgi:formimidoylglutamate deiminase
MGLRAVGFEPGARADFVVLDADQTDLACVGEAELLDAWIFSTGRRAILKVAAGGELVVENGRHRARERIDARYRAVVAGLLKDSRS